MWPDIGVGVVLAVVLLLVGKVACDVTGEWAHVRRMRKRQQQDVVEERHDNRSGTCGDLCD